MRQSWPWGHWALLYWHRQRPEVAGGLTSQLLVWLIDSHARPAAHGVSQPPQCSVSDEMSTQEPEQQRRAGCLPQLVPSATGSDTHEPSTQLATMHGLSLGQSSPGVHAPAPSQKSETVQSSPSSQAWPAGWGSYTHCPNTSQTPSDAWHADGGSSHVTNVVGMQVPNASQAPASAHGSSGVQGSPSGHGVASVVAPPMVGVPVDELELTSFPVPSLVASLEVLEADETPVEPGLGLGTHAPANEGADRSA